jgi:hypothetical protein
LLDTNRDSKISWTELFNGLQWTASSWFLSC